jgi:hypothetical protein
MGGVIKFAASQFQKVREVIDLLLEQAHETPVGSGFSAVLVSFPTASKPVDCRLRRSRPGKTI